MERERRALAGSDRIQNREEEDRFMRPCMALRAGPDGSDVQPIDRFASTFATEAGKISWSRRNKSLAFGLSEANPYHVAPVR